MLLLNLWPRLSENDDATGSRLTANYTYDSHPTALADSTGQLETVNQLPPVVQVTMVVLNESSVARLSGTATQPPTVLGNALLNGDGHAKFGVSTTAQHQADINDLSARLTQQRISFEVFTTSVPMRESRWGLQSATP